MKAELKNSVDKIIKAPLSITEKSIALISLSEMAYIHGDMTAYSELMEEVKKLNPELVKAFKGNFLTLANLAKTPFPNLNSKNPNSSCFPDIDFDE